MFPSSFIGHSIFFSSRQRRDKFVCKQWNDDDLQHNTVLHKILMLFQLSHAEAHEEVIYFKTSFTVRLDKWPATSI